MASLTARYRFLVTDVQGEAHANELLNEFPVPPRHSESGAGGRADPPARSTPRLRGQHPTPEHYEPTEEELSRWRERPAEFLNSLLEGNLTEKSAAALHAYFRSFNPAWVNHVMASTLDEFSERSASTRPAPDTISRARETARAAFSWIGGKFRGGVTGRDEDSGTPPVAAAASAGAGTGAADGGAPAGIGRAGSGTSGTDSAEDVGDTVAHDYCERVPPEPADFPDVRLSRYSFVLCPRRVPPERRGIPEHLLARAAHSGAGAGGLPSQPDSPTETATLRPSVASVGTSERNLAVGQDARASKEALAGRRRSRSVQGAAGNVAAAPRDRGGHRQGVVRRRPPVQLQPDAWDTVAVPASPLHVPLTVSLGIRNVGRSKATVNFRTLVADPARAAFVQVEPPTVLLRRDEFRTVQLHVQLLVPNTLCSCLVAAEVVGGLRIFIGVRVRAEPSVFRLPLWDVPFVKDRGFYVPQPLAVLRRHLQATSNNYHREGIFRLASGSGETAVVRWVLDQGATHLLGADATDSAVHRYRPQGLFRVARLADARWGVSMEELLTQRESPPPLEDDPGTWLPHRASASVAAQLIKVFLREIPMRLLDPVPPSVLESVSSGGSCEMALQAVQEPHASVLSWTLRLLADVVAEEEHNKMTTRNCGIIFAPNLVTTNEDANPMSSLVLAQKAGYILYSLVEKTVAEGPAWLPGWKGDDDDDDDEGLS